MPKPNVYVYLDEFERDETFVLTAVLIPIEVAPQLLTEWNELRRTIKKVLISQYPDAPDNSKLVGDQLPEIHAVDLYQSYGYYRKYPPGTKRDSQYWRKHHEWLESSLKIIQSNKLRCISISYPHDALASLTESVEKLFHGLFATMEAYRDLPERPQFSRSKFAKLSKNKYLFALSDMLIRLESYLKSNGLIGEIICDDHSMSRGFSATRTIEWLKANGYYNNLSRPRFADGLDEALLQVPDVLCYVSGRSHHAKSIGRPLIRPLRTWHNEYLKPALIEDHAMLDVGRQHVRFIVTGQLAELCIFDDLTRGILYKVNAEGHAEALQNVQGHTIR